MKAMVFRQYGATDVLKLEEVPTPGPGPGPGEVLVKVFASSVNPVDWKLRAGGMRLIFPAKFPKIGGFDVSGVVAHTGPGVSTCRVGDTVYGLLDAFRRNGAHAEYVIAPARYLAEKPEGLTHKQAAAIPLAGLTAWQSLNDWARVKTGEQVLILGASGGVGTMAVQTAKSLGALVTGVCSSRNVGLVEKLGADEVVAYDKQNLSPRRSFDVIFNAVGLQSFFAYSGRLYPRGRYVTTLPVARDILFSALQPWLRILGYGKRLRYVFVKPDPEGLRQLARLAEAGKLTPAIEKIYALAELAAAHRHSQNHRVRGKLVIQVAGE